MLSYHSFIKLQHLSYLLLSFVYLQFPLRTNVWLLVLTPRPPVVADFLCLLRWRNSRSEKHSWVQALMCCWGPVLYKFLSVWVFLHNRVWSAWTLSMFCTKDHGPRRWETWNQIPSLPIVSWITWDDPLSTVFRCPPSTGPHDRDLVQWGNIDDRPVHELGLKFLFKKLAKDPFLPDRRGMLVVEFEYLPALVLWCPCSLTWGGRTWSSELEHAKCSILGFRLKVSTFLGHCHHCCCVSTWARACGKGEIVGRWDLHSFLTGRTCKPNSGVIPTV